MRKKLKKSFIPLMIFLVLIISIGAISAADAENIDETASAGDEIVLEETDTALESSSDEKILSDDGDGTFTDLNNNLTGKTEVTLESDYTYSDDTDSAYANGITIDRELTIDGNGHKITGNNNKLFTISNTGSLILKNLVITSTYAGYTENDMIISNNGNLTFDNVNFTVEREIIRSGTGSFYYNTIVNNANMFVKNSVFKDSTIKLESDIGSYNTYYYGLINNAKNSNIEINNTLFNNNQLLSSYKFGRVITIASLIHNEGTAILNNISIFNNRAGYNQNANPKNFKGFIYNNGGTLEILKSTIKDNVMEFATTNSQRNGIINSDEGSLTFNNNIIYDNTFENYEVEATGTYSIDNNYWGTNNPNFIKLTNNKIANYVILGFNPENAITGEEKTFEVIFTLNNTNTVFETLPNYNITVNSKKLGETTVEIKNGVGQYKYLPIIAGEDTITIEGADYIINVTEAPAGTFTDLNYLIAGTNEVNLYRDYTYISDDSALQTGITINKEVIINGNGYTINSTSLAQLFNVETAGNLTLRNVILITDYAITSNAGSNGNILNKGTILFDKVTFTSRRVTSGNGIASALYSEGTVTIKNSEFVDSISNYTGTSTIMPYGLIYNKGTMTLENSLFKNNGVYSKGRMLSTQNGILYNTKTLNIKNTTFENNFITYEGTGNAMINGIIYAATGTNALIDNCTFKENVVSSKSTATGATYLAFGTLCIKSGTVTVTNCDFIKNSAWTGSAIAITPSSKLTFTSENNTFIENSNNYEGTNPEGGCGGAIYVNYQAIFNSVNDKFISNSAVKGGAIYARTYVSSTTSTPANVTVTNAIFEGNTATIGSAIYRSDKTTANNNYWGGNNPEFDVLISDGTTSLTPDNHVVITIEGKPIVIPESKATFTVNFKTNDTDAPCELQDYAVNLSAVTNRVSDDSVVIKKGTSSFTYYSTADKITDTIIVSANSQQKAVLEVTVEEDPTGIGTFRELNRFIQNATDVLNLVKDYTFDAEIDAGLETGIVIDKTLTINGHGFKINGTNLAKLFDVTSTGNLTLKDVILVSDYVATGSYNNVRPEASFKNLGIVTLDNVTFTINQKVTSNDNTFAAGIYNKNKLNILNSKFIDSNINTNVPRALGLIDNDGGILTIENTIFDNNSLIETTTSSNANGLIYNMGTLVLTNVNVTNNFMKNPNYGLIRGYTNSQITVKNCVFENNTVEFEGSKTAEGGVIYLSSGSATISHSKFINNTGATTGGAISSSVGVTFINNTFERNTATSHGGAIKFASSSTFINNTFKYNKAEENGGALYGSSVTIQSSPSYPFTGNVFIGNEAKNGGAIYSGTIGSATTTSVTTVKNNTFINNKAIENGGAIHTSSSAARFSNSVFIGNTAKLGSVLYSSSTSTSYSGKSFIEYSIIDNNIVTDPTGTVFKYSPTSTANNNYWGTNNPTFDSLVSGNAPENFIIITIDGNETLVESDNYVINFVDNITKEIVAQLPDYSITVTSNINNVNPSSVVIREGNAIFTYIAENKGQDTIKLLYNDDEKTYLNINVNLIGTPVFNITSNDVTYGDELDLTFRLTEGPEGYNIYIWTIYDEENNPIESDYLDTTSGKIVYANEYAAGKYTIKVALKDVEGWEDLEVRDTFEVKQAESELTPVITVNEDNSVEIQVTVTSNGKTTNAAGKINTLIDIAYEENVEKGIATIKTNVLSNGTYNAVIAYSGDKNYTGSSAPITVTIKNIVTEDALNLTGSDNTDKPTFSIKLPEDAKGNLTVTIENTKTKALENGQATITFDDLTAGKHQATITYTGDNNYKPLTKTINITVTGTPSFNIVAEDVTYGEALNFTFTITSGPTESDIYKWTIFSKFGIPMETGLIDSKTKEILYTKDYSAGNYTILVSIRDVEGWEDLDVSDTFEIKQKEIAINATIKINDDNSLTITTSIEADGKLVNASGDMNTTIDKDYGKSVENGQATISTTVLTPNKYDITLIYSGDNNYKGATVTIPTTIRNIVPEDVLNISGSNNTNTPTFSIKLPETARGNLTVTIGNKTITQKLKNGSATITFENLKPGNHTATVTYTGDENNNPITKETTVKIPKKEIPGGESALSITTPEGSNSPSYTINLSPDATGNLTVTVDGKYTYTQTLVNGSATVTVPKLPAGPHTITVSYSGDENYSSISKTTNINVAQKTTPDTGKTTKKVASKIIAKKKTFKAKKKVKKYTITLKAGKKPIKKVKVTLKIKGKTYKAKTNAKGKATFKIKKLTKKGKHIAVIKFKGNKLYKATTKKVKITIKK
ncbi:Ig-like domain repeat protein [Methanobrevibacter sp.]